MRPSAYHLSDADLMSEVQRGAVESFSVLVGRYERALLRAAQSRCGRRDLAEEIVQETFLAAYKSRHTFDLSASFAAWLWTILLNESRRRHRRQARREQVELAAAESDGSTIVTNDAASREPAPLAQLLARERRELMAELLGQLPEVEADALRLRFFGELKFREIAEAMSCSLPAAKNRVRRGLLRLNEMLTAPSATPPPAGENS
jgi:RNA polymerase sigma-70 factor (ECF subfamily)